jgi:hypothetical protein
VDLGEVGSVGLEEEVVDRNIVALGVDLMAFTEEAVA